MKYLFVGLLLLALLLAFCLWSGSALARKLNLVIGPMQQAVSKAEQGQTAAARERVVAARRIWQQHSKTLAASLDHSALDAITLAFAALQDAPNQDLLPQCRTLLLLLQNLKESDSLTIQNLL